MAQIDKCVKKCSHTTSEFDPWRKSMYCNEVGTNVSNKMDF